MYEYTTTQITLYYGSVLFGFVSILLAAIVLPNKGLKFKVWGALMLIIALFSVITAVLLINPGGN